MGRRRELTGVANALTAIFCSRTNDYQGAWLPGVLCHRLLTAQRRSASIDLLLVDNDDEVSAAFASRGRQHIAHHCRQIGLSLSKVRTVVMRVDYDQREPNLPRADWLVPVPTLERMGNLVPIIAAGVGALATVAVQLLISRGEPADLKRLAAINSILGTMPADHAGWSDLANARTHLAVRVAQGVVAPPRTIRTLRRIGWMSAILGALLFAGSIALFAVLTPAGQASAAVWMQVGLYTLFLAPLILYLSWLWQELRGLPQSIRDTVEAARVRLSARHANES